VRMDVVASDSQFTPRTNVYGDRAVQCHAGAARGFFFFDHVTTGKEADTPIALARLSCVYGFGLWGNRPFTRRGTLKGEKMGEIVF